MKPRLNEYALSDESEKTNLNTHDEWSFNIANDLLANPCKYNSTLSRQSLVTPCCSRHKCRHVIT